MELYDREFVFKNNKLKRFYLIVSFILLFISLLLVAITCIFVDDANFIFFVVFESILVFILLSFSFYLLINKYYDLKRYCVFLNRLEKSRKEHIRGVVIEINENIQKEAFLPVDQIVIIFNNEVHVLFLDKRLKKDIIINRDDTLSLICSNSFVVGIE